MHLRSLLVADLSSPAWLPTLGARGPCLPERRPSRYVGKFAVFIKSMFQWLRSLRQIPASNAGGALDLPAVDSFPVGAVSLSSSSVLTLTWGAHGCYALSKGDPELRIVG